MSETFSKIIDVTLNLKKGTGFSGSSNFTTALKKSLKDIDKIVQKGVNVSPIVTELEKLNNIKVPNLRQLASGFTLLTQHINAANIPDFSPLVTQIKKLAAIKDVPKLGQLGEGLRKIVEVKNVGAQNVKITSLSRSLSTLKGITLPNLAGIGNGLERISRVKNTGALNAKIVGLSNSLRNLDGIKLPNLPSIASGLKRLSELGSLGAQNAKLVGLSRALRNFSGIKLPPFSSFISGLQRLVNVHNIRAQAGKLNTLQRALRKFNTIKLPTLGSLVSGLERLEKLNMGNVASKVNQLASSLFKLRPYASMINSLGVAFSKMSRPVQTAQKAISKETESLNKFQIVLNGAIGRIQKYTGYFLISRGIQELTKAIEGAIGAIISYDQGLKNLQAITQATTDQVLIMGDKIKQVASDTKFSAAEVADGMVILGQAGLSAKETIQAIGPVADLATATLSDMAGTVDLVTTALRVFNIDASNTAEVADVFASAVTNSKLTIDKLRTSFNFIGPIAVDAGVSFKETAASLGILANSGLRASKQATSLRSVLVRILSPSDKLVRAANKANVSLKDIDTTTNSFSHVLNALRRILTDTTTGLTDAGLAADLFGKRGVAGVLALVDSTRKLNGFDAMLAKMDDIGLASKMAQKQLEGLGTGFKNLQDKLKNLAIAIGDAGVTGALKSFLQTAKDVTTYLTKESETSFGRFIIQITGVGAAILGTVTSMGLLAAGIVKISGIVTVGLEAIGAFFGVGAFPVTAAIAAFIAVGIGLTAWFNKNKIAAKNAAVAHEKFRKAVNKESTDISSGFNALNRFNTALKSITSTTDSISRKNRLDKTFEQLFQAFPRYTVEISNTVHTLKGLKTILDTIKNGENSRYWDNAANKVKLYSKELRTASKDLDVQKEKIANMSKFPGWYKFLKKTERGRKVLSAATSSIADDQKTIENKWKSIAIIIAKAEKEGKNITTPALMASFTPEVQQKVLAYVAQLVKKSKEELKGLSADMAFSEGATVESLAVKYKDTMKQRGVAAAQEELYISSLVAKGVKMAKEGEKMKLEASKVRVASQLQDAKKFYQDTLKLDIANGGSARSKASQAAFNQLKAAEKSYYETSSKMLGYYSSKIKKTEAARARNIVNRTKLEEAYGKKVEEIDNKINSNVLKYNQKIAALDKSLATNKLNLTDSVAEEIRKINQKGVDDTQKQVQNEQAAYVDLAKVKSRLAEALKTGDVSGAENLKGLLNTAHQLFGSLSDKDKAVAGLRAYEKVSKTVLTGVTNLKKVDADKEFKRVATLLKKQLVSEKTRHDKKLSDLLSEFNKESAYIKKLKTLQASINVPKAGENRNVSSAQLEKDIRGATDSTKKLNEETLKQQTIIKNVDGTYTSIATKLLKGLKTKVKVDDSQLKAVDNKKLKDKHIKIIYDFPGSTRKNISTGSFGSSVVTRASGGEIPFLNGAKRGIDSIRALLTPGEYVIKESVVKKLGTGFFDAINNFKMPQMPQFAYASGGSAGGIDLKSSLGALSNMGAVSLELGNSSYPVIGNQNVISTLINHLQKEKLMRSN